MFEVGFSELLLIAVLGLIVLGPEKLPKVAAQIGRWIGRARSMARQFREQLEDEVSLESSNTQRKRSAPGTNNQSASSTRSAATTAPAPAATAVSADKSAAASEPGSSSTTAQTGVPPDDDMRHNDYDGAGYQPPEANAEPGSATPGANAELNTGSAAADDYRSDHQEIAAADDEQRRV